MAKEIKLPTIKWKKKQEQPPIEPPASSAKPNYQEQAAQYKTGMNREEARKQLDKRILDKLASLTVKNPDEIFKIEDELEEQRRKLQISRKKRLIRKRRRKKQEAAAAKAMEQELAARNAEAAKEKEKAEADVAIMLPGQITFADFMHEEKKRRQKSEKQLAREAKDMELRKRDPQHYIIRRHRRRKREYLAYHWKRVFRDKVNFLGKKAFAVIEHVDLRYDTLVQKGAEAKVRDRKRFHLAMHWADLNKARILKVLTLITGAMIGMFCIWSAITAYEYAYNGKVLGLVDNQEDVIKLVDVVSQQLSKEYDANVSIDIHDDISFNRIVALGEERDNAEEVLAKLTYMQDMDIKAIGIYVDNVRVGIVDNEKTAEAIIEDVINHFMPVSEQISYESVSVAEKIDYVEIDTKLGQLEDRDEVVKYILTGGDNTAKHVVQAGETFAEIAVSCGMTQAELAALNPDVMTWQMDVGQELMISKAASLVTVQTVEVASYIEYSEFTTTYEDNDSMYTGETMTKIEGIKGESQVTAKVVRNNGEEVASRILSEEVLSEPSDEVVYVGTKELPKLQGTGTFQWPLTGTLTSRMGPRWGRMHYGIDLGVPTGTRVRASDGGTVTFAGYQSSYGYVVRIDHGGGFATTYAHLSSIEVTTGEKVYQGQYIADSGNTGNSTGPHLHFEIRYLDEAMDPLKYLP